MDQPKVLCSSMDQPKVLCSSMDQPKVLCSSMDQPKVRASKAEKRAMKQAVLKERRRETRKLLRQTKVAKKRFLWESLSEEERAQHKAAAKAKELEEERVRRVLLERRDADTQALNVCIDLGFENEHSEKEKRSLCKQLQLTYSVLKRSAVPVRLHVCNLGQLSSSLYQFLRAQGFDSFPFEKQNEAPYDIWPKSSIVLLSPDAVNVVESFDDDKVYVIGGIVDRTVKKAATLGRGESEQVSTMRLPIPEYLGRGAILNIDTVVQTICRHRETGDWARTLRETVPLRRRGEGATAI
jgi:tRNA (guanine9-N1)-methyltransferase